MSTEKKAPVASSTKDLARTLGKKELMGIAIGQIIGAGIMSMMGVAIAMTGRSANLAFHLHHLLYPYERRYVHSDGDLRR